MALDKVSTGPDGSGEESEFPVWFRKLKEDVKAQLAGRPHRPTEEILRDPAIRPALEQVFVDFSRDAENGLPDFGAEDQFLERHKEILELGQKEWWKKLRADEQEVRLDEAIEAVIAALPEFERGILAGSSYLLYSDKQIAESTGLTVKQVRKKLRAIKKSIVKELERRLS